MTESTARQLFELAFAFLAGAVLGAAELPFYILRQVSCRLGVLWDALFYALAGLAVFAAAQWCSGGVRLRFLVGAAAGCALCAYLLAPLRRSVHRLAERKREQREEQRREKEKMSDPTRKKDEKI